MAFVLWETLKESISAYADLSPVTLLTSVTLGLALFYAIWVMFRPSAQPQQQQSLVVKDKNEVTTSQLAVVTSSPLWDVFLSFCGQDTRGNFISHLYHALDQAEIVTFLDEPALEKGEEISRGLPEAIRNSKMFVVVISENYADSSWCLDELVEILSCKRTNNQVVIPVFYYIDPSHLRHHNGSFGAALKKHEKRHSVDRIHKWKSALAEFADLSGYHLKDTKEEREAHTVQHIVQDVLSQVPTKAVHLERGLFGIDLAVEEIYQQLSIESNDVRALGICGMGGIGKTTIAKAFYNKHAHEFDISCFMENDKQNSQGASPPLSLLHQLLKELLRVKDLKVRDYGSALRKLEKFISSKKALVVLDDLDQYSCSELLVRIYQQFSVGSRIIFTARDTNLPNQLKVAMSNVDIYMVKHLDHTDSLKLFSYHAFNISKPPGKYLDLSECFVMYTGGLPLALKVLGSSLCGRTDVSFWKVKLEKVKKIPLKDIQKVLQLSYDELEDETVKAIFRYIVFFFLDKNINEAIDVFKSCGFFPEVGIPILVERSLLTIDLAKRLQMHNLIQDMGRNVKESKHGLLYLDQEEASQTLPNTTDMDKIEALVVDCTTSINKYCNAQLFERLPNLRLIKLVDVYDIKGKIKASFHELRYISWHGCPWTHLSYGVHLQKLVVLDMPFSRFETLWKIAKLSSLRHLNLEGCIYLKELPDSIGHLTGLYHLNLNDCVKLKRLPKPITQLTTLSCLNMSGWSNLKQLPEQLGELKGLKRLNASCTAIEQLPDSIAHLKKLGYLDLRDCKNLRKLPEQFGNMEGLVYFNAGGSAIEQLQDSFSDLLNLVHLNLSGCSELKRLPEQLGKMQCLEFLDASHTAIKELPDSIGSLPRIKVLGLAKCEKLTYVPNSIRNLKSIGSLYLSTCEDIVEIELIENVKDMNLQHLGLSCNIRLWLPIILSFSSLISLSLRDKCGSPSPTKPFSFFQLSNLTFFTLTNSTTHGSSFPELPLNLRSLQVESHASLEQVPDLSYLKHLKDLYIVKCCSLQSLHKLPPHLSRLTVTGCTSLQDFPDVSMLRNLEQLEVTHNGSNLKVNLEENDIQLRSNRWFTFEATVPNKEIAEWFDYKNREGCTLSFEVPPNLGDDLVGVAFWVVHKCSCDRWSIVETVITNKTQGMTTALRTDTHYGTKGDRQSSIHSIKAEYISMKNGDEIMISFPEAEVSMCGAHILKRPSGLVK
nr:PREDICTED: disease resistance protein TAO1-like [Daucus carota subsp. sativus]